MRVGDICGEGIDIVKRIEGQGRRRGMYEEKRKNLNMSVYRKIIWNTYFQFSPQQSLAQLKLFQTVSDILK